MLNEDKQNFLIDCYLFPAHELEILDILNIVDKLPASQDEQNDYLKLCADNKLSAQLYLQLSKLKVEENLLAPLKKSYESIKAKNLKRLSAGLPVLQEMQKRGIEVIILKGNAIAEEIYGDIGYKPMNDIDILIKKSDLEQTLKVFSAFELISAAPLEDDIHKQAQMSHHAPPFFTKNMDAFLGTHWNIAAPTRGLKIPIEDFWSEKEEFLLNGQAFHRLSPLHFLFHLCVHLNAAKTGLREVADIVKILQHRDRDIDVHKLIALSRLSGAQEEVYEALILVQSLLPHTKAKQVSDELKNDLAPSVINRIAKRTSSRIKILHLRTNYISKIEKTFAFFMMSEDPLEKTFLLTKMWRLYLFVPVEAALKLNYEMQETDFLTKVLSVLKAPAKIGRVFIKDLGLFIFLFVTMRHQWVLARSWVEFPLKKIQGKKIKRLEDFARDLGLTLAEIKELEALD